MDKYDLIHGRDILIHIGNRDEILLKLSNAFKPGGWILLEEPDVSVDIPDPAALEIVFFYLHNVNAPPFFFTVSCLC
jgi:2-polyprenyl-3-methyl-5-hydroxy-6-metoxy-1,4-benzoquinol methylase